MLHTTKKINFLFILTMLFSSYVFSDTDIIKDAYENELSDLKFAHEQINEQLKETYSLKYSEIKNKYSLAYDQVAFIENENSVIVKNETNKMSNKITNNVKKEEGAVQNEYKRQKNYINQQYSKIKSDPDNVHYKAKKAKISQLYDIKELSKDKLYDVRKRMSDYYSDARYLANDDGEEIESFMKETAALDRDIALAKLEKAYHQDLLHSALRYHELKRVALKKYTEAKLADIKDPKTGKFTTQYISLPSYQGQPFVKNINIKSQKVILKLNDDFSNLLLDYTTASKQINKESEGNTTNILELINTVIDKTAQ